MTDIPRVFIEAAEELLAQAKSANDNPARWEILFSAEMGPLMPDWPEMRSMTTLRTLLGLPVKYPEFPCPFDGVMLNVISPTSDGFTEYGVTVPPEVVPGRPMTPPTVADPSSDGRSEQER